MYYHSRPHLSVVRELRCSSSSNMQEKKESQADILKMASNISLEQIFNEIVELRKEMKDYNKSAEFLSAKFDDMNKAITELRSENDSLKLLCEELKTEKEKRTKRDCTLTFRNCTLTFKNCTLTFNFKNNLRPFNIFTFDYNQTCKNLFQSMLKIVTAIYYSHDYQ